MPDQTAPKTGVPAPKVPIPPRPGESAPPNPAPKADISEPETEAMQYEGVLAESEPFLTGAGIVQDNVSTPGVQRTHTAAGVSEHGEALKDDEVDADDDDVVDAEIVDADGDPSSE